MGLPEDSDHLIATLDLSAMSAHIKASVAASMTRAEKMNGEYRDLVTPVAAIADMSDGAGGVMHAASLTAWLELAKRANVPHVEAELIATLPVDDAYAFVDETLDPESESFVPFRDAIAYAAAGGFWRTDLCAGGEIKWQLSSTGRFDIQPYLSLDDPRIMDMHFGIPDILILGRPLLTPIRVNGWPVEFRVFIGGEAREDGAVAWYYPQTPEFDPTPELIAAAAQAREHALAMTTLRDRLGLLPFLPGRAPDAAIGATIDFMLTEERGLVMIDAGPGYGYGAHPCTFIDSPVEGVRWRLADGVEPR